MDNDSGLTVDSRSDESENVSKGEGSEESTQNWYVIHTYSGYESKVKDFLLDMFDREGVGHRISELLLPMEDVVEIRKGKKKISPRKFFPGYLLIKMEMDEDLWYMVKNAPRVTGFLGGNKPTVLRDAEVGRLLNQMSGSAAKPKHKVEFEVGENVRVNDGPFTNFNGVVDEVNMDKGKVKVMVSIFGRSTSVELEFPQVERV
ncbi:MAG: transcription termination/antitermination protein NusG [Nitrospinota bacterium]